MATLTLLNTECGLRLRKHAGALVLAKSENDPCCCDACVYEFCIVNSNFIKDNSWDVYINGNLIGNYSGAPNTNICLPIQKSFLINPGNNVLEFRLVACTFDDYFEFVVNKKCPQEDGSEEITLILSSNSGFINSSFFTQGICTTTIFSRNFVL